MKNLKKDWKIVLGSAIAGLIVAVGVVRCGGSDSTAGLVYTQIERLGRPGINEALVTENALLNAYNSVAPSVDLTTPAAPVITNVARTLTALYAGGCLLGFTPPGTTCKSPLLGTDNKLSADNVTQANIYIGKVVDGFLPDVLRIDTSRASGYNAATCQGSGKGAMLCGGRGLTDNVIDITYGYLLAGDATGTAHAELANGTTYAGVGGNLNQGHKAVGTSFPYAPAPY